MGAHLTSADKLNGGGGNDTVSLNGDYSAGVWLGAGELQSIETISLVDGYNYNLTLGGGDIAAGKTLTIDGSALTPGSDNLLINGSAETTGSLVLIASAGFDSLIGGAGNDTFVSGGGDETIAGGGGNDTVVLSGNYSDYQINPVSGSSSVSIFDSLGDGNTVDTINVTYAQFADQTVQIGTITAYGTAGNDSLDGTAGNDTIDFSQGGTDTVSGLGGNDTLIAGAALTGADSVDGGAGTDTLSLSGNYSGTRAITLGATTLQNVETLVLGAGFNYSITTDDANVAAGQSLTVDGSAIGAGQSFTFNGAAELDGSFIIDGASSGGSNKLTGGAGNDTFNMGAGLSATDTITGGAGTGGAGNDTVYLSGNYYSGLVLGASTITGVETIAFAAGYNYNLTSNDGTVGSGKTLTVDATGLSGTDLLTFNGVGGNQWQFRVFRGRGRRHADRRRRQRHLRDGGQPHRGRQAEWRHGQ